MKRILVSLVLINISLIFYGQNYPDLELNGEVTWIDSTHIRVVYDWSNDAQLLDWAKLTAGTSLIRNNGKVTVSGGAGEIWAMQWKQGIKCSRILAENVKTGSNVHVNIYTNNIGGYHGSWNPSVNIGVVLRGWGSVWQVDGVTTDLPGYGPVANSPETYDLNISKHGMTFKSSRDNVLHTYTGDLAPTGGRFIALGAWNDNTEWGKLTIEGEITSLWQYEPVPANSINIQSNGATFAPVIEVVGNPDIEWTFNDSTTSTSANPIKKYGSTGSRHNYLKVTPWSSLIGINVGYDAGDGGYGGFALVEKQNVLGFQNISLAKNSLQYLCASNNLITELDFREFNELKFVELLNCKNLTSLKLGTHPALERLCVEDCSLDSLDISGCPALGDLRAALNEYTFINFGSTGQEIWHICIRDNPKMNVNIPPLTQFPKLRELLTWNDNQTGAFICNSSIIEEVESWNNHYTSADISGCTSLKRFDLSASQLSSLNLGTADNLTYLRLDSCGLTESIVDYVLYILDNAGQLNGCLELDANEAPSSKGLINLENLKKRGWTTEITRVPVTDITITGEGGEKKITTSGGTLQLYATVLPLNSTDKTVSWSIVRDSAKYASIDSNGLVKAVDNGLVTTKATANDGTGIYDTLVISISDQKTPLTDTTFTIKNIIVTVDKIEVLLNYDFISWEACLFNLKGELVLCKLVESNVLIFNISSLSPGIYFLKLSKGNNIGVAKIIKP